VRFKEGKKRGRKKERGFHCGIREEKISHRIEIEKKAAERGKERERERKREREGITWLEFYLEVPYVQSTKGLEYTHHY
jgi:hypothetical protein